MIQMNKEMSDTKENNGPKAKTVFQRVHFL